MATYQYRLLSGPRHFRILKLQGPLLPEAVVKAELSEANLDSSPAYEALSYTWESQTPSATIVVGGKALLVTQNCEKALRRLLRGRLSRTVWVDSICINQASIDERNHQVRLMGEIYQQADRVNIWLGPSTQATDTAMTALNQLATMTIVSQLPGPFKDWRLKQRKRLIESLVGELGVVP